MNAVLSVKFLYLYTKHQNVLYNYMQHLLMGHGNTFSKVLKQPRISEDKWNTLTVFLQNIIHSFQRNLIFLINLCC